MGVWSGGVGRAYTRCLLPLDRTDFITRVHKPHHTTPTCGHRGLRKGDRLLGLGRHAAGGMTRERGGTSLRGRGAEALEHGPGARLVEVAADNVGARARGLRGVLEVGREARCFFWGGEVVLREEEGVDERDRPQT